MKPRQLYRDRLVLMRGVVKWEPIGFGLRGFATLTCGHLVATRRQSFSTERPRQVGCWECFRLKAEGEGG